MLGKIALEEAFQLPGFEEHSELLSEGFIQPERRESYLLQIADINNERLKLSDSHGIGYTVVSLTSPGIQHIHNAQEAATRAAEANDWAYEQISSHRNKLGAFAALSMHDPVQAGQELRRCVEELGFHGALLNDFQHAGSNGETYLFYDQPKYDAFWRVVEELDVVVYLHPAAPSDAILEKLYSQRTYLIGPPLSFANGVNLHLLGIITNGVLDRFPKLKIIVGHLGEHIPFDLWRINHWFEDVFKPIARKKGESMCAKTIYDYFRHNIWVTTSGHFSTKSLKLVVDEIGADRVLFSVDYPYETMEDACGWWDGDAQAIQRAVGGEEHYHKIGRDNAFKLLKLGGSGFSST